VSGSEEDNLAVVVAWLDAMRRRDLEAAAVLLDPDVRWRGLPEDAVCVNREEVVRMLEAVHARPHPQASAVELVAGTDGVVLGVRADELREIGGVPLAGQLSNVFRFRGARIVTVEDYAHRTDALRAAGATGPGWA
jgi:ketosteroid isomerase-like protein